MIISTMPCHLINSSYHWQVRSIGSCGLQNECELHYNTADCVLTSGCSFLCQHIWIKICMVLAVLGRFIENTRFSTGKRCMQICILRLQINDSDTLSARSDSGCGRWSFEQKCRQHWFGSGVCAGLVWLRQLGRGPPVPLSLQSVCEVFPVPFWQGRYLAMWFWGIISGCLSIGAVNKICPGNTTHTFFSSWTLVPGFSNIRLSLLQHTVMARSCTRG